MTREQRRFARLDARLPVTYCVLPATTFQGTKTKNISGGGICMAVEKPLDLGTLVEVMVKLPSRGDLVTFTAKVVWCESGKAVQPPRSIEIGLQFVSGNSEHRQALLQYIILNLPPTKS